MEGGIYIDAEDSDAEDLHREGSRDGDREVNRTALDKRVEARRSLDRQCGETEGVARMRAELDRVGSDGEMPFTMDAGVGLVDDVKLNALRRGKRQRRRIE